MAAITVRKSDGPAITSSIHLDELFIVIPEDQTTVLADGTRSEATYDSIDVMVEEYPLDNTGTPDLSTQLDLKHYVIEKDTMVVLHQLNLPESTFRLQLNKSFYRITFRLRTLLEGSAPGNIFYSKETVINVNNFLNWLYPEAFRDTILGDVSERFKNRNYLTVFGNITPQGGVTNDIQILSPEEAYVQDFTFDSFYEEGFYSASFESSTLSWWEIEVASETAFTKHQISAEVKNFLISFLHTEGVQEKITDRVQEFTSDQILSLYNINLPDDSLYIPFSYILKNTVYTVFFIGDFNFIKKLLLQNT